MLSLYAIIFSLYHKIGSIGEGKGVEDSSISHTFFLSWCEEYNLLFPLLGNGCTCSLIDPFVSWPFLFESIPLMSKARKFVIWKHEMLPLPILVGKTALEVN